MQSAIESVFANLVAKHVQNQAAFAVGVAVEFAGVVKVVAYDGLGVESARPQPLLHAGPSLVIRLILRIARFAPRHFKKSGEALVQPDIPPVLAGHQVAEPLM